MFGLPENLEIIVHSQWLKNNVERSFLGNRKVHYIPSGIDISDFNLQTPTNNTRHKIILGVASIWDKRKGLDDFIELSKRLNKEYQIVLVGLSKKQISNLPNNIQGINRTESIAKLAKWYNKALVFINPTYQDNFPTTNLEALACGTPVITYNTGGSPEAIDDKTGFVVEKGDIEGIIKAVHIVSSDGKSHYSSNCRNRAERLFDKQDRYQDYIKLYQRVLEK